MANVNPAPYVAKTAAADWNSVHHLLETVARSVGDEYWAILETSFEITLSYKDLEVPRSGIIGRGRLFGELGEVRFRYDGSLPANPYRLTLVAEAAAPLVIPGFNPVNALLDGAWQSRNFTRYLWGEPLTEYPEQEKWFVSRIPTPRSYPGVKWGADRLPIVHGWEYSQSGLLGFYRFTKLDTIKKG